eukprot:TRINITY_DN8243_c0_g1_i4.p1 TRINITY_DN8243_c0_g1~~TRINITY_DN8243_c0_g1_i4.p1  ORF type:complete len:439 (-),score=84.44 TRINITY_DN8243_c0_g1_i4:151-1410(-)
MAATTSVVIVLLLATLISPFVHALNNGLGLTPPMGWNTWCTYGPCETDYCNQTEVMSMADAMASNGMYELGYRYINLDDCWADYRNSTGWLQPDPQRFPDGMAALADYIHSKGLYLGVYTDSGVYTCSDGGRPHKIPGSYGHYQQDADQFASWGIDYVKMDWCHTEVNGTQLDPRVIYPEMSQSLNSTGRRIFFALCEWGVDQPWEWASKCGNSWRIGEDHHDEWSSTSAIIEILANKSAFAAPGGWNDPDFLMTGGQGCTANSSTLCPGQTWTEYITEFSIWSIANAPLIIATNIRNMSAEKQSIVLNKEVIAINQDPLGIAGERVWAGGVNGSMQVWTKPIVGNAAAAILYNADNGPANATITLDFSLLPGDFTGKPVYLRDLWAHEDLGSFTNNFTAVVAPHGVVFVTVSPNPPSY